MRDSGSLQALCWWATPNMTNLRNLDAILRRMANTIPPRLDKISLVDARPNLHVNLPPIDVKAFGKK